MSEPIRYTPREFCEKLDTGLAFIRKRYPEEAAQIDKVRHLHVGKSCLLDRLLYCGEDGPSLTPCPVHKGRWSGLGFDGPCAAMDGDRILSSAEVIERGCRCYKHKCGCTTGWQPDAHCGCLPATSDTPGSSDIDYRVEIGMDGPNQSVYSVNTTRGTLDEAIADARRTIANDGAVVAVAVYEQRRLGDLVRDYHDGSITDTLPGSEEGT